ncbi:MAG: Hydroxypyruvate isomerase [Pseudomonadota bacterium]
MPQFAANLSMMYPDMDFLDRFEAAAKDGFKAVEYLFPYAYAAEELAARLKGNGLQQVLFNMPPGGIDPASISQAWEQGVRGTACIPGREAEYQAGVKLAMHYAEVLNCPRIHSMAGLLPSGVTRAQAQDTLVANLKWACQTVNAQGLDVLLEPINPRGIPGFFVNRQDHAHEILAQVGEPNLKVQMDLFHCQIVEGDVTTKVERYLPTGNVGHFQIADVPLRHEPGTGELNWPYLFDLIDRVSAECGWQGWVGCEYVPADVTQGGTSRGLSWLKSN